MNRRRLFASLLVSCAWFGSTLVPVPATSAEPPRPQVQITNGGSAQKERDTRLVAGWSVHISTKLIEQDAPALEKALQLLRAQLEEIVRVVPQAAVTEFWHCPEQSAPSK